MRNSIWKVLVTVLLILVLGGSGAWIYLRTSLPKTNGSVSLIGIDGQVEIVRDPNGVPHIFASTDHDAYFALGYVHAQDRIWQMEFQRRTGAGRLSEILGEATLDVDKFLRTLGTYRAARSAWSSLSIQSQSIVDAYVAGINAWLDEGHTLPPEFLILGVEPDQWTAYDVIVWSKMMMWDLGGNWENELLRGLLMSAVGEERAGELMPGYPQSASTIISADSASSLLGVSSFLRDNLQMGGLDVGSNSWVVGGSLTDSGMPMLANDPHLGARIPSIWYLVELQGGNFHATGATLPGLPIVAVGHNDDIAWGMTNLGPDVQDLYIERINPENPNQYEVDGVWKDMIIVEEKIVIKDEVEPLLYAARSTRHGPLISDVTGRAVTPLALRWTALEQGDTTAEAFLNIVYASNWSEFSEALRDYVAPGQNIVYADREGNIGYRASGRIPVRARGSGTVPVPGWQSEYEWEGWIPFEDLPYVLNPDTGYIVTANNRVVPDDYPYFISSDWAPPYRAERAEELIEQITAGDLTISMDDMAGIQSDQMSRQVSELLPLLLAVVPNDDGQAVALEYLRAWDGDMDAEEVAPTVYSAWFHQLGLVIFEDDLRGDVYEQFADRMHASFLTDVVADNDNPWCDNVVTVPHENCADAAEEAMTRALDVLETKLGNNMEGWQWGEVHEIIYSHNPFSEVGFLRPFFQRQIGNGGGPYTLNVGPYELSEPYEQTYVSSYRQIVDLSEWNSSLFMHTTGQSGNIFSKHYDDLISRHQAVEYIPMSFGRGKVSGDILVLKPE